MKKMFKSLTLVFLVIVISMPAMQAQNYITGSNSLILVTETGGRTFTHKRLPLPPRDVWASYQEDKDTAFFLTAHLNNDQNSYLYKTTNGGNSFVQMYKDKNGIRTLAKWLPPYDSIIVMATQFSRGNSIGNYYSIDGGGSFSAPSGSSGNYDAVTVVDSVSGWVLKNGSEIRRTTNFPNGNTKEVGSWPNVYSAPNFLDVEVFKGTNIITVGTKGMAQMSTDGGSTWADLTLPGLGSQDVYTVEASPSGDIVLIFGNNGFRARSTDAGATWSVPAFNPSVSTEIRTAEWIDEDTVFVGTKKTDNKYYSIYKSTDGGALFTRISYDSIQAPRGGSSTNHSRWSWRFSFPTPQVGWMIARGRNGGETDMLRTTNGGQSWHSLGNSGNLDWRAIRSFDTDTAIASDTKNRIRRTTDAGATWTDVYIGKDLASFYWESDSVGYATGEAEVVKTTDAGQTWTVVNSNVDNGTFWNGIDNGIIVGNLSKALLTTDYATYTPTYPRGFGLGRLNDLWAMNRNVAYVVGNIGTVVKTTNGGTNWDFVGNNQLGEDFKCVAFIDADTGVVAGTNGTMLYTTDAGQNWTPATIDGDLGSATINDVAFTNETEGMAVADNGILLITTDAGMSWTQQFTGTTDNLLTVTFKDGNFGMPTAAPVVLDADTLTAQQGTIAALPVTAQNFSNLIGIYGGFMWDTTKASFAGLEFNPFASDLTYASFDTTMASEGKLKLMWMKSDTSLGATLMPNDTLFKIRLLMKGTVGDLVDVQPMGHASQIGAISYGATTVAANLLPGQITISQLTGLKTAVPNHEVTLYPNPAHTNVLVQLNQTRGYKGLELYNTNGALVMQKNNQINSNGLLRLNIASLPKGVYTFRALFESEVIVKRLIIQ